MATTQAWSPEVWGPDAGPGAMLGQRLDEPHLGAYMTLQKAHCAHMDTTEISTTREVMRIPDQGCRLDLEPLYESFLENFATEVDGAVGLDGARRMRPVDLLTALPPDLPTSPLLEPYNVPASDPRAGLRGEQGLRVRADEPRGLRASDFLAVYRGQALLGDASYAVHKGKAAAAAAAAAAARGGAAAGALAYRAGLEHELKMESYAATTSHFKFADEAAQLGVTLPAAVTLGSRDNLYLSAYGLGNAGCLVNDPQMDPLTSWSLETALEDNVCMCEIRVGAWPWLVMFAFRDVAPGGELRYSYGEGFWEVVRHSGKVVGAAEGLLRRGVESGSGAPGVLASARFALSSGAPPTASTINSGGIEGRPALAPQQSVQARLQSTVWARQPRLPRVHRVGDMAAGQGAAGAARAGVAARLPVPEDLPPLQEVTPAGAAAQTPATESAAPPVHLQGDAGTQPASQKATSSFVPGGGFDDAGGRTGKEGETAVGGGDEQEVASGSGEATAGSGGVEDTGPTDAAAAGPSEAVLQARAALTQAQKRAESFVPKLKCCEDEVSDLEALLRRPAPESPPPATLQRQLETATRELQQAREVYARRWEAVEETRRALQAAEEGPPPALPAGDAGRRDKRRAVEMLASGSGRPAKSAKPSGRLQRGDGEAPHQLFDPELEVIDLTMIDD